MANRKETQHLQYLEHREVYLERARQRRLNWTQEEKDRRFQVTKQYGMKLKTDVFTHYSMGTLKCARCGINDIDVLCIDHINGGGYAQKKQKGFNAGYGLYSWLRKNNYPEGYQILCANCNQKKRIKEKC